jgi:hypothetical protein
MSGSTPPQEDLGREGHAESSGEGSGELDRLGLGETARSHGMLDALTAGRHDVR